jgi:HlyD family secretion protein
MDRPVDPLFKRRQIVKRWGLSLLGIGLTAGALLVVPGWIKPSVSRSRIRTATVDHGPIEATIMASGTVLPEVEQVLSSPIDARVIKILKRPGAVLASGEPIVELDVNESRLALERLHEQIALKENQQAKLALDLENTLIGLHGHWEIKKRELQSFKLSSAQSRTLREQGLLSENELRQSELQEERAAIELKQIEDSIRNARQSTQTQLEGLALEMKILQKERSEAQRQLDLATTKSDRNGVLTWVVSEEGATIRKGDVIARLADLGSFRVEATVSDVHAARLTVGLPVKVNVNDHVLTGRIANVLPTVQNGIITVVASLEDKSNQQLRSNLRVDVFIVTAHKDRALRIKKGPFANGEGAHDVFVIRGPAAIKSPVRLGISSFEHYEVVEGLLEGDEVIISDMRDYLHLKEVSLK